VVVAALLVAGLALVAQHSAGVPGQLPAEAAP